MHSGINMQGYRDGKYEKRETGYSYLYYTYTYNILSEADDDVWKLMYRERVCNCFEGKGTPRLAYQLGRNTGNPTQNSTDNNKVCSAFQLNLELNWLLTYCLRGWSPLQNH